MSLRTFQRRDRRGGGHEREEGEYIEEGEAERRRETCTERREKEIERWRERRSEERRVGKECRSRWSPDH